MKTLSALCALLRRAGGSRRERVSASRLNGLGVSKIRSSATKVASPFSTIDLASGAPAFSTPHALKQSAVDAINQDHNQYCHPSGDAELRRLIAERTHYDMDREVTITCGTSAALGGVLLSILEPGDEVIVFAPFFESYTTAIRLAGGAPRYVPLTRPGWSIDKNALARAFNKRTRAVILNWPHNPTGRVFSPAELECVAQLCEQHNVVLISDEIYSQIVFEGVADSLAFTGTNGPRNIIVDGLSKGYNATGWRVGYVLAPAAYTDAFRVVHSIMGLSAPTPLQIAARNAFSQETQADLRATVSACRVARDVLCAGLADAGFRFRKPDGATYVFADASHLGAPNADAARDLLFQKTGITSVSGPVFFEDGSSGAGEQWLRFCFARDRHVVEQAAERLRTLR